MKNVAADNHLKFNEDVKKQTVGTSPQKFLDYLEINPNNTLYSVVWCTSEWTVEVSDNNLTLPCQFGNN